MKSLQTDDGSSDGNNSRCLWKCLYQVRAIAVFPVFRLLTDFVCLLTYEFCLSLWKIARCSVILLLPLFGKESIWFYKRAWNAQFVSIKPFSFFLELKIHPHHQRTLLYLHISYISVTLGDDINSVTLSVSLFHLNLIHCWTCSRPEYCGNTARWPLSNNQSINLDITDNLLISERVKSKYRLHSYMYIN